MQTNEPVRVLIAGTRTFSNYPLLKQKVDHYLKELVGENDIIIVSGKAPGADTLGEQYAEEHNYPVKSFPADWAQFGKSAGPIRNEHMAEYADVAIIFWDGISSGTKNMIDNCEKHEVKHRIIHYDQKIVESTAKL